MEFKFISEEEYKAGDALILCQCICLRSICVQELMYIYHICIFELVYTFVRWSAELNLRFLVCALVLSDKARYAPVLNRLRQANGNTEKFFKATQIYSGVCYRIYIQFGELSDHYQKILPPTTTPRRLPLPHRRALQISKV